MVFTQRPYGHTFDVVLASLLLYNLIQFNPPSLWRRRCRKNLPLWPLPLRSSKQNTKSIVVIGVAAFAALLISWWHYAAIVQMRWHSFGPMLHVLGAYLVAIIIAIVLLANAVISRNRKPPGIALTVFSAIVAISFYTVYAGSSRGLQNEIAACIALGVEKDCKTILNQYANDPRFTQDDYVRIYTGSDEYNSLPESILAFKPVYVTIERLNGMPPNVGLCKNGFGGFHMGLRVFGTDPKIAPSPDRVRVTPICYLWIDET